MTSSNYRKHARKVSLDSAINNAIEKAVDARKVAAFTVGAAGVLAGAAFAFGATPAMAAEATSAAEPAKAPVAAGEKAGKKADGENADGKADAKSEAKETVAKETAKQEQAVDKDQTEANKEAGDTNKQAEKKVESDKKEDSNKPEEKKQTEQPVAKTEDKKSDENQKQEATVVGTDREAPTAPESKPQANSTIKLSKDTKDTLPNMYAWGKSDNVYIEEGQNTSVTFTFAKPDDGYTITKVAIFPSDGNTVENDKSRKFLEYYSAGTEKDRQPYSGTYDFQVNANDGTAKLTMTKLYNDGNLKSGESYSANRCIYVYGTDKNGNTVVLYKTNIARAATLIPPKNAGSIVLKYNEKLTEKQIQDKLKAALDAPTAAKDGKSVREQIVAASKSNGVGVRNEAAKTFTNTPDTAENKVIITDKQAYDVNQFNRINTVTSKNTDTVTTYTTGVNNLKTHLVSDLGYKSEALALTVARYDTRIEKPIVEDPTNLSKEVKEEIAKKLANLNHIAQDKVTINAEGTVTINFEGVDPSLAPTIKLSDLVLKQLEEKDVIVPTGDKAVFVANPLAYSDAEIKSIKKAIYEANKKNDKLGLSDTDYEKQISLSYLTGDLTASGHANQGISNGQAENTITVKIKTDKAVAEFTSNVKESRLTKIPNIRTDYDVSWTKDKIDGRVSDEGLSWSEDKKTIIYRYDPTAAQEFDTNKILNLLTAKPKEDKSGLPTLTGGETLAHEGDKDNPQKSHVGYVLKDGQPTTELSLGNMDGAYWKYSRPVDNSGVDLGDNLSDAGSYSWDDDAKKVTVAAKKGKVYKARLFVLPYGMTMYRNIYIESGKNPWNTTKAINVIFVPQTNHKTKDLKTSVEEHKTVAVDGNEVPTQSAYYNASKDKKDAYDKALQTAKTLLDSVKDKKETDLNEEQKAQIDNATINLNKARAELDGPKTDKEKLKGSIEADGKAAQGTTAATGTQATNQFKNVSDPDFKKADGSDDTDRNNAAKEAKKAYDKALEDAKTLNDDENATQKAVDDAKAKLDAARAKLNDFTTSKDKLNAAIAEHGHVFTYTDDTLNKLTPEQKLANADPTYKNATPDEREAYDNALEEAMRLAKDPATSQKEVNEAIAKLEAAKKALDAKATDKSQLIAAEKLSFDNPDKTDESKQSTFYKNALNKKDNGANDQEKQAAKTAVENYDNALAEARKVLKNDKATQAEVDDAKKKLEAAEKVLHDTYATDPNELTKVLADNFSGYLMPAYFNAFDKAQAGDADAKKAFKDYNDAYQKAKELKKNFEATDPSKQPTATDIADAKKALEDARKVIDKYATNTSRLSAAVFNDLAIQNSPAYANVKELADKQNPSEEEKAQVEAAKKAKEAYEAAVAKLNQALNKQMPRDKANGKDIPDTNTPDKDGKLDDKDYLNNIQAHAQGEPLDRDVDTILKEMNAAAKALDKYATKTDDLIKSINEDATTHPSPAFKNASQHKYQKPDGSGPDDDKNNAAKAAAEAYGKALNEAKDLLNNPNATQKDINDAKDKLDKARKALDAYNTDVAKLEKSVGEHGKDAEGTNPAVDGTKDSDAYRNASDPHFVDETGKPDEVKNQQAREAKTAYDKALTEAQALLAKHNDAKTPQDAKPTQVEIDAALEKLDEARKTLVGDDGALDKPGFGTNTTDLDVELAKSSPVDATDPTPGTVEDLTTYKNALAKKGEKGKENPDITRYKEALKKATELAAKQKSTKASERPLQKDVDEAYRALLDAKKIIADGYKTDATALQDEAALGADDGNFTKSPEYKNADAKKGADDDDNDELKAYKAALTEVTTMLNNFGKDGKPSAGVDDKDLPTQAQVDAALKKLSDARKAVEAKYKTKTDKLENEVGDKDETGQPVTPPFEASVPYKNALEKAKTEDPATTDANSATKKLEAYNEKLKAAQDLIAQVNSTDPNADPDKKPTQKQVDDALDALKKAKQDLADAFKTNASALKNEADDKDEHGTAHTPAFESSPEYKNALAKKGDGQEDIPDVKEYQAALKKANDLLAKFDENGNPKPGEKNIPTQQEVDEALQKLKDIKEKITANYKTSSVNLQKEVDLSKDGDNDKRDDVFENTPAFKNADAAKDGSDDNADMKAYKEALKKAKGMLEKFDRTTGKPKTDLTAGTKVPTQKELDEALDALQAAKKKIEDDYSTIKYDLRQEAGDDFTKSPEYQNAQAKGDDASKQALDEYKNALDEANSVLDDPNATQSEVDAALKKLQEAKAKLRSENGTDKSGLQSEADDDAKFRKSVYFIIGNKADIEAYENALAEARSVLADPNATQAQVDEALRKLQAAKYKLNHPFGTGSGSGIGSGYDPNAGDGFAVEISDSQSASVDKSALQIEVNNAVDTNANTAAARAYRQALAEARRVLADENATQAQVDAALRNLKAARAALLNSLRGASGASGLKLAKTGAETSMFASIAAAFAGLGVAGVASRRRKHSNE